MLIIHFLQSGVKLDTLYLISWDDCIAHHPKSHALVIYVHDERSYEFRVNEVLRLSVNDLQSVVTKDNLSLIHTPYLADIHSAIFTSQSHYLIDCLLTKVIYLSAIDLLNTTWSVRHRSSRDVEGSFSLFNFVKFFFRDLTAVRDRNRLPRLTRLRAKLLYSLKVL